MSVKRKLLTGSITVEPVRELLSDPGSSKGNKELLTGPEASGFLEALGVKCAPASLPKLRCVGGGPRFVIVNGRYVRYRTRDLIEWAQQRLSGPFKSTSEAGTERQEKNNLAASDQGARNVR